ncbi:MAG TPA: hypothetical protein VMG61_09940, partial [Usitatibacter sp.]|nr:hypothetical protein [Usitatibacter sp.]
MRVFMVHGVNAGEDSDPDHWQADWEQAFRGSAAGAGYSGAIDFHFATFNAIFEDPRYKLDAATILRAIAVLGRGAFEPAPPW